MARVETMGIRHLIPTASLVALTVLLPAGLFAQTSPSTGKSNFSGNWLLDRAKSDLGFRDVILSAYLEPFAREKLETREISTLSIVEQGSTMTLESKTTLAGLDKNGKVVKTQVITPLGGRETLFTDGRTDRRAGPDGAKIEERTSWKADRLRHTIQTVKLPKVEIGQFGNRPRVEVEWEETTYSLSSDQKELTVDVIFRAHAAVARYRLKLVYKRIG